MLYLWFSMTIHYYYIIIEIFITQYIMRFFAFHLSILSKAKNLCFISCINYKYCFKIITYFIFQILYLWFSMTIHYYCYIIIEIFITQYIMRFFAFHLSILSKAKNLCFISCINYKYCFKIITYFICQMLYLAGSAWHVTY